MLTRKEQHVLELKKKGLTQQEIALQLKISQPAVSAFYRNALKKISHAQETLDFVETLGTLPREGG